MSSNLIYRIIPEGKCLPDDLKFALREKYGEPVHHSFGSDDIDFLTGLKIGKVEGAERLIELIEKHGTVLVKEEY